MNEGSNQEMEKSMMNTMVECKSMINTAIELIRKLPGQGSYAKRMEELENNTKEEAMRLEEVSKNLEATGKFLWDTAKKVEKIQTDFDDFVKEFRAVFDAFVIKNSISTTAIEFLRIELKDHIQFFQEPRKKEVEYTHLIADSIWVVIGLLFIIGVLCVVLIRVTSGH